MANPPRRLAETMGRSSDRRMQFADLYYIASSVAAQTTIAENYIGLPL